MATRHENEVNPESCWNRALPDEPIFILRAKDVSAPETIRRWVSYRLSVGKNQPDDRQILEALDLATEMENWRSESLKAQGSA